MTSVLKDEQNYRRVIHKTNFARGNAYLSHILCPLFQLCSSWIGYKVAHGCQPLMTEDMYCRNNIEIIFFQWMPSCWYLAIYMH